MYSRFVYVVDIINISFTCRNLSYRFKVNLRQCLLQINGYKELFEAVEELRKQVFDSENEEHENMLLKVIYLIFLIILRGLSFRGSQFCLFSVSCGIC